MKSNTCSVQLESRVQQQEPNAIKNKERKKIKKNVAVIGETNYRNFDFSIQAERKFVGGVLMILSDLQQKN